MLFLYFYIIIINIFVAEYVITKSVILSKINSQRPSVKEKVESENIQSPTEDGTQLTVEQLKSVPLWRPRNPTPDSVVTI